MTDQEETLDLVPLSAVALPGQEVQLRFRAGSAVAQLLQSVFDRGHGKRRFGLVFRKEGGGGYAQVGTVANLESILEDDSADEELHPRSTFCCNANAVSAFRLVRVMNGSSGSVVAMSLGEGEWRHNVSVRPFPAWVYRDTPSLTCQLKSLYAAHFNKPLTLTRHEGEGEGEGEQDLSFQVASELFRRREERISILSENSTSVRLFRCIEKLSKSSEEVLSCSSCSRPLAMRKHMVNVAGAQGACGVYTNPHGFVHSTVTVNELISTAAVFVAGLPTIKDTWFPGYKWQILYCRSCHAHLGWRFSKDSGEEFYGFRHESIAEREEGNVDVVEDIEDEDEFEDALEQGDEDEEDEEFEDAAHEEND